MWVCAVLDLLFRCEYITLTVMSSMTQQNAALVEEASAASMSLSNEASTVKKMLSTFKI